MEFRTVLALSEEQLARLWEAFERDPRQTLGDVLPELTADNIQCVPATLNLNQKD